MHETLDPQIGAWKCPGVEVSTLHTMRANSRILNRTVTFNQDRTDPGVKSIPYRTRYKKTEANRTFEQIQ